MYGLHVLLSQRGEEAVGEILVVQMVDAVGEVEGRTSRHVNLGLGSHNLVLGDVADTDDVLRMHILKQLTINN